MPYVLRDVTAMMPARKHGGDSHDQLSHGSWADGQRRAESLYASTRNFQSKGGRVEMIDPKSGDVGVLRQELIAAEASIVRELEGASKTIPSEVRQGIYYSKQALYGLEDGHDVFVARGHDGSIVGALSGYQRSNGVYEVVYLGSTGVMTGVGSALMSQVMERAAESGLGLWLISDPSAESWWKNQVGLTFSFDDSEDEVVGTMPQDEVESIARSLAALRGGN